MEPIDVQICEFASARILSGRELHQSAMNAEALYDRFRSVSDAENWLPLGAGALLLLAGASQRSAIGACLAVSSAPLLYRGITGRWPDVLNGHTEANGTRAALSGARDRAYQAWHAPESADLPGIQSASTFRARTYGPCFAPSPRSAGSTS